MRFLLTTIFAFTYLFNAYCFGQSLEKTRIGIIGAGPSGLIAAERLKKKGYENVVILEQNEEIGGKVKTVYVDGLAYEMGAVVSAADYNITWEIAEELGIELKPSVGSLSLNNKGEKESVFSFNDSNPFIKYPTILKDFLNWFDYAYRNDYIFEPGFKNLPPQLATSFEDFMKKNNMTSVLEAFRPIMVGCGYAYAETAPAAYWLKLIKTFAYNYFINYMKDPFCLNEFYKVFENGWQNLWVEFAKIRDLNVQLNSKVIDVYRNRDKNTVEVITDKHEYIFDRLIITVPHKAHTFLDLNALEQELFDTINTVNYKVTLAKIEGLPKKAHMSLRENSHKSNYNDEPNDGKPVLISNNHNTDIYQVYQFTEEEKNNEELIELMHETINNMGGNVNKILKEDMFEYFPHFGIQAFKNELAQNADDIQGIGQIFYTGAVMNFETVELSASHADYLIRTYF